MRIKVDAVSKFGVKVDGKWVSFDKKFKPIELRKGDVLDVEVNDAGFITKASLIEKESVSKQVVREATRDVQRDILKGQCLKIATDYCMLKGYNLEMPEGRKKLFDLSVVLFAELQNAGYLKW